MDGDRLGDNILAPAQALTGAQPRASGSLTAMQTGLYAKELRGLFFQARDLRSQLASMEERLRTELQQMFVVQEEEKEWIALEVHDRIAQLLASVFQQLQMIEGLARSSKPVREAAVRASLTCRDAIRESRNIMNDLSPPALDALGLVPVLEDELQRLSEDAGCRVEPDLTLAARPSKAIELTLYRIFREIVANIRKHAHATQVEADLEGTDERVHLQVMDNGVGFDPQQVAQRKRVGGLLSMQRRAELVGGVYRLASAPGQGTRVSVWLPTVPSVTARGKQLWKTE